MAEGNSGGVLGLIPAKGGSTRLKRKNIVELGGRPLLAWTAAAALESGVMDRVVLSTEDEEIAAIGRELGLDVPFMRPDHLALDPAGVDEVALHLVETLESEGENYQTLIYMLPTCPFRTARHIQEGFALFQDQGCDFMISVAPFPHTPFAALALEEGGVLRPHFPEYFGKKSQEMPDAYRPNGALHIMDVEAFKKAKTSYPEGVRAYVMGPEESLDIDSEDDLAQAEALLAARSA